MSTEKEHIVGYLLEDEAYMEQIISLYEQEKEEVETEISKSPYKIRANVLGIGVAVIVNICGF